MKTIPNLPFVWEYKFPKWAYGGMRPTFNPFENSVYVSDGWGNHFSTVRLRELDLNNGNEIKSILLRDTPNKLLFHADQRTMFAVLNARIVEIDKENFEIRDQWKEKVPKYSMHGGILNRKLLLMNWLRPTLTIYDLENRSANRKIVGSCTNIVKISENDFLICCGKEGIVWNYCCADNRLSKIIKTPQFKNALLTDDGCHLLLSLGNPYSIYPRESVSYTTFKKIRIYNIDQNYSYFDFEFKQTFDLFSIDTQGNYLFLSSKKGIFMIYKINDGLCSYLRGGRIKSGYEICAIDVKRSIIIGISHNLNKNTSTIGLATF